MIYRIAAVFLMLVFYGAYFLKMLYQKKQGIVTDQMGKGKKHDKSYRTEIALKTVTILVPLIQLVSIVYGYSMLRIMGKIIGIYLALLGDIVFIIAVRTMKDSWRAGIARDDERGLVTEGIYRYSRNPAFLAFDLLDLGILLMFFNPILLIFTVFAIVMFHLQLLQEEEFLTGVFGDEYVKYRENTCRYIGYGKMTFDRFLMYMYFLLIIWSILYFVTALIYGGGFSLSWVWLWLLIAGFAAVRFKMLKDRVDGNERIKIPTAVKIAYRVLFCIFLAIFIFVEAQIIRAMSAPKKSDLEYVIVLGAGVNGTVPRNPLRVRIERAAEYMSENEDTILIASGGQGSGEDISEAECIRSILVDKYGIDNERIILEDRSTDTEENFKYSYEIINDPDASVGVITNGFHELRALSIAKRTGFTNTYSVPAVTLYPVGIHYVVREFFGMIEYYIKGM